MMTVERAEREARDRAARRNPMARDTTLRDYFAAKAMQSLLEVDGTVQFDLRAKEAYNMADAMLKAREAA